MSSTKRKFGMHPHLLFDIILRQAGTLQKALLEGVMNSIDAGATSCKINLDTHTFSIEDDGRGFQSDQEIEDYFETFGTPHKEGDATYGRFRMGRGQLMAYGRNHWRSRQFEMDVDVKKTGLDYVLTVHDQVFDGTRITAELYDPIAPSELERTKNELRKFVAWAQIPVYLNGEIISKQPADGKWTYQDEDAYYALSADRSHLAVYNLGVLVNEFSASRFGVGGTIVTKTQVQVNFARNDIQSGCPDFKRIQDRIKKQSGQAAKKKVKLNDAERGMLVREFLAGELDFEEAASLRAITDVNGRTWPIDKLLQIGHKFGGYLVVAARGDQMVETAQSRGVAFSIDEGTLERFGAADGDAFIARIKDACLLISSKHDWRKYTVAETRILQLAALAKDDITVVDRKFISSFVDSDHIALADGDLNVDQKSMLHAIEAALRELIQRLNRAGYEDRRFEYRQVFLGKSETAYAWTDGTNSIWVDVEHARLLRRGYSGAYQVALTLLHEMLHSGPDTGTHQHDFSFYEDFHNLSGCENDPVGGAAERMIAIFMTRLRQNKKKISRALLAQDDVDLAIAKARQAAESVE